MSSTILDDIVGSGAKLPHVYCKKIKVENMPAQDSNNPDWWGEEASLQTVDTVKVTLNLAVYERVIEDNLNPSWFKQFAGPDKPNNMLDYIYLHVQPVINLDYLKPTTGVTSLPGPGVALSLENLGSVYSAPSWLRARRPEYVNTWWPCRVGWHESTGDSYFPGEGGYIDGHLQNVRQTFYPEDVDHLDVPPISVRISDYTTITEETIDGIPYHVIPFQKIFSFPKTNPYTGIANLNLGFMFYTWLYVKGFFMDKFDDVLGSDSGFQEYLDNFRMLGPINTEIVYEGGQIAQKRQEFFLPDGKIWEGPVHLHHPDMYTGLGVIHGDPSDAGGLGANKGWMAGQKHIPGKGQPKLTLAEYPNYKIDDFTTKGFQAPQETVLGINPNLAEDAYYQWTTDTGNYLSNVISPFQKENRRYLLYGFAQDNDTEYSKLYLTRGVDGRAKGVFYINYQNLLVNNSKLFESLKLNNEFILKAIDYSSLMELKIYRNRVKRHNPNIKNQEIFKNDTLYEDPPTLVASISDYLFTHSQGMFEGKTFNLGLEANFGNIKLIEGLVQTENSPKYAFFSFDDPDSINLDAGRYQYSIEFRFKDGTYKMIRERLQGLVELYSEMSRYYELSMGKFSQESAINTGPAPGGLKWDFQNSDYEDKRKMFTPWYDKNLGFHSGFEEYATDIFHPWHPENWTNYYSDGSGGVWSLWEWVPLVIDDTMGMFEGSFKEGFNYSLSATAISMAHPATGSPEGIEFFLKILSSMINKLQILGEVTKIKSGGGTLTINNSSVSNLNKDADPAPTIIHETHSFDELESLYIAATTKDVWFEYLTPRGLNSLPSVSSGTGIRTISKANYELRCRMEARKYLNTALDQDWSATGGVMGQAPIYSNLGPSIVYYSDPTGIETEYFESFSDVQLSSLSTSYSQANYTKLLYNLNNFSLKKKETEFADVVEPSTNWIVDYPEHSRREAAKKYAENLNITVHGASVYNNFFDKRPGAGAGAVQPFSEYKDHGFRHSTYFSDQALHTDNFIIAFTQDSSQNLLNLQKGFFNGSYSTTGQFMASLKTQMGDGAFNWASTWSGYHNNYYNNSSIQADQKARAYIFLHINTAMFVTRFTVSSGPGKLDAGKWTSVGKFFLDSLQPGQKVLCRLKPVISNFKQDMNIPILDEYFFIEGS